MANRYFDDEEIVQRDRKRNKESAKELRKQARRDKVAIQSNWMESDE